MSPDATAAVKVVLSLDEWKSPGRTGISLVLDPGGNLLVWDTVEGRRDHLFGRFKRVDGELTFERTQAVA